MSRPADDRLRRTGQQEGNPLFLDELWTFVVRRRGTATRTLTPELDPISISPHGAHSALTEYVKYWYDRCLWMLLPILDDAGAAS